MASSHQVDKQTFLDNLRQSGLLSAAQLNAALLKLPDSPRGRVIARALVNEGLITKFQAEQLLAGRINGFFLDQYRILEQLGQGGMARVYKAEHKTMARAVALKILAPSLLRTERAQDLFGREIRAVAQLIHPHIVTAFDSNKVNGRYYLILEFINGPNLDQFVRDKGPLPHGLACEFIRQAALGLQFAHEKGMVHRDIKPANLLLQLDDHGRPQTVKVSDFGLARLGEKEKPEHEQVGTILTKDNTIMGTPDFLSPEQSRDLHHTDIRSDLYSLGGTFYFLLTRRVPFPGGTVLEKLVRHSTDEPTPIASLRPDVPAEVMAIVSKLMAKDPAHRFQTPAEAVEALTPLAKVSPSAWSGVRPIEAAVDVDLVDSFPTTAEDDGADPFLHRDDDDPAALIGTMPVEFSPTPISVVDSSISSTRLAAVVEREKKRQKLALILTLGILGALLTVGGLILWILSSW